MADFFMLQFALIASMFFAFVWLMVRRREKANQEVWEMFETNNALLNSENDYGYKPYSASAKLQDRVDALGIPKKKTTCRKTSRHNNKKRR